MSNLTPDKNVESEEEKKRKEKVTQGEEATDMKSLRNEEDMRKILP